MGYAIDQDGIIARYNRERENWQAHLDICKKTILNFIKQSAPQSIAIIGSGWLLDIPVQELERMNIQVHFIDIVQPYQVRYKYRNIKHFHFHEIDALGGTAIEVYKGIHNKTFSIDRFSPNSFILDFEIDAIVSLNILNQLDILLLDYIKENIAISSDEELEARKKIQQSHLTFLKNYKYCLISDIRETATNIKTNQTEKKDLCHIDLPENLPRKEWQWIFDTEGMYKDGCRVLFDVIALQDTHTK